jgi:pimeloyl-ACP methyl ester carboxylesterase
MVTTKDRTEIYYKDWGSKDAQPIVFHHGWPLSGDDWDTQLLYFLGKGYRVGGLRCDAGEGWTTSNTDTRTDLL